MLSEKILMLLIYGLVPYLIRIILLPSMPFNTNAMTSSLGSGLAKIQTQNKILMMLLMSVPEQAVLYYNEKYISMVDRILVSVASNIIRVAWNGMDNVLADKAYNDLVWILGSAFYAFKVIKVRMKTVSFLIIADSIMALSLRGLGI